VVMPLICVMGVEEQ